MSSGRPRSFITALRMRRTGASAMQALLHAARDEAQQRGVDEDVHLSARARRWLKMSSTSPTR
jgi:predicted nucleic acid-binding Zn ribbon protein